MSQYRVYIFMAGAVLGAALPLRAEPGAGHPPPPVDYTVHPQVHAAEAGAGPQRVVSIAPSITEMCAALGLADRIVGRTQYCTHPPAVRQAAVVGAYADTNFERIIALRPDIVLITASSGKLEDRLSSLGLAYATVPDNTLEDIYGAAEQLGRLLHRPQTARLLVQNLRRDVDRLSRAAGAHRGTRVLFTFSPLPPRPQSIYVVGPGGYLDSLLHHSGYANALADRVAGEWAQISVEAIIAARPDVILEVRPPGKAIEMQQLYRGWAALGDVPALRDRRIRSLQNTAIVKPGPRINVALHEIITALSE